MEEWVNEAPDMEVVLELAGEFERSESSRPKKGMELSEEFYEKYGCEMIHSRFPEYESMIAVGVAGEGSDCFGYDDDISRDHDFEAGFCMWIPDRLRRELEFKLSRAYEKLPESFLGVKKAKQSLWGNNRRGVILTGDFYSRFTGRAGLPESPMEWLSLPEHSLACAVNGIVFRDDLDEFSAVRRELQKGYPEDVRLKKIAARAVMMAQAGQYNVARCLKRGEYGAAALALSEFIRNALSMAFLLSNRYMPYYKWAFRAGRELPGYVELVERLEHLAVAGVAGVHRSFAAEDRGAAVDCGTAADISTAADCGIAADSGMAADCGSGVVAEIEEICGIVIRAMKSQGLTDGEWDYLEPHGYQVVERIHDASLRNLHVMDG